MAKIELYLRLGMEVNAKIAPNPNTFSLMVRGLKQGQYIILEHPAVGINLSRVAPDAKCSIRYVSEGRVTSFVTQGITVFKRSPLNVFVIEYPKTIQSQISLRKHRRIKATIPTSVDVVDSDGPGGVPLGGMVLDISFGGVLVASSVDIPVEKTVSLTFEFITGQSVEKIQAKIKNKRTDLRSFDYPYLLGCEFTAMKPEEKSVFQNFFHYCFKQLDSIRAKEQTKVNKVTEKDKSGGVYY